MSVESCSVREGDEERQRSERCGTELGMPGAGGPWVAKRRMTVMAVIIATIGSFGLGMTLVWSAIALKYLKEEKTFGEISESQESWIGSIIYLGALISAPLTGILVTTLGRKKTMLVTAIPCLIGWLLIAFAQSLWMIYLGRFITGFCGGAFTVAVPTYVSEVTEDRIRGTLGTVMILMLVTGIEVTFILGAFVSWFWLSIGCATVPLVFFLSMIFMPESPRYLVINRQPTAARRALKWLRRASTKKHIEPEISQIENSVSGQTNKDKNKCGTGSLADLTKFSVLKPVGISVGLMAFSQLSGVNGISLYTSAVFEKAGTKMDPRFALIIIFGAQALSVLVVTFFLVERFGRKSLLLLSQGVMIVGLVGFGLSFHVQVENKVPEELGWLPLTSLVTFIIGYNVGMGPLPWLVTSEVLPPNVRELASAVVTLFYWALSFVAGITFIPLEILLGNDVLYWVCAGVTFLSALFVHFLVPETKGKSAEEIQNYFEGKRGLPNERKIVNSDLEFQFQETEVDRPSVPREGISNPGFEENDGRNG